MIDYIAVIVSQILFGFLRTLNVRYTSQENMIMTLVTSFGIKITWLFGTFYGVKSMFESDYVLIICYLVSGILGDRLSFYIKTKI